MYFNKESNSMVEYHIFDKLLPKRSKNTFPHIGDVRSFLMSTNCSTVGPEYRKKLLSGDIHTDIFIVSSEISKIGANVVVGVAFLKRTKKSLFLTLMCTKRSYGREMLIKIIELAIIEHKKVVLCSIQEALHFYERLGFKLFDEKNCNEMKKYAEKNNTVKKLTFSYETNKKYKGQPVTGCGENENDCIFMQKKLTTHIPSKKQIVTMEKLLPKEKHLKILMSPTGPDPSLKYPLITNDDLKHAIVNIQQIPMDVLDLFSTQQLKNIVNNQTLAQLILFKFKNKLNLPSEQYFKN